MDSRLGKGTSHLTLFYKPQVDSTNDWAKKQTHQLTTFWQVYLADHQLSGRGRGQNRWYNGEPGTCLLISFARKQFHAPSYLLSARLGLALYRAFTFIWPKLPWRFKAPNDIYLGEGKVAGLLIELLQKGEIYFMILGVGINVFDSPRMPSNQSIKAKASCLQNFLEKPLEKALWQSFLKMYYEQLPSLEQKKESFP